MTSYRFCRPDDIPLLVEAVNSCYSPHFPKSPPLTIQEFKKNVRELNLWASSCMVGLDEKNKPIAVCIGAKRKTETLIHQVGVHPDYLHQGHGTHILTSLRQKLAVLGPPRLIVEVPKSNKVALQFFESLGFKKEKSFFDFYLGEMIIPKLSAEETDFEFLESVGFRRGEEFISYSKTASPG